METKHKLCKIAGSMSEIFFIAQELGLSDAQLNGLAIQLNSCFAVIANQVPAKDKLQFNLKLYPELDNLPF